MYKWYQVDFTEWHVFTQEILYCIIFLMFLYTKITPLSLHLTIYFTVDPHAFILFLLADLCESPSVKFQCAVLVHLCLLLNCALVNCKKKNMPLDKRELQWI